MYGPFHVEQNFAWAPKNVNLYPDCPHLLFISMFTLMLFSALFKLIYSRNAVQKKRIFQLFIFIFFALFLCWCKFYKLKANMVPSQSLAHGSLVFHFYMVLFDMSKLDSLLCLLVPQVAGMFLPPCYCMTGNKNNTFIGCFCCFNFTQVLRL